MSLNLSGSTMCTCLNHAAQHGFENSARNKHHEQLFFNAEGRKISVSQQRGKNKISPLKIRIIILVSPPGEPVGCSEVSGRSQLVQRGLESRR